MFQRLRLGCTTPVCPTDRALTPRHDSETLQRLGVFALVVLKGDRKEEQEVTRDVRVACCYAFCCTFTFTLKTRLQNQTVDNWGLFVPLEQPTHITTPSCITSGGR